MFCIITEKVLHKNKLFMWLTQCMFVDQNLQHEYMHACHVSVGQKGSLTIKWNYEKYSSIVYMHTENV